MMKTKRRAGLEIKSRAFSVFKAAFPSATARRARREKKFLGKRVALVGYICYNLFVLKRKKEEIMKNRKYTIKQQLPAYPLFVKDPFFSVWSPSENLNESDTVFWTGKTAKTYGLIYADGKT